MLTKRTDEILGKSVALINISADFAYISFLLLCCNCRLGLNMLEIVFVSDGRSIGDYSGLSYICNKQGVGSVIIGFNYFAGDEGIAASGEIGDAVFVDAGVHDHVSSNAVFVP